MKKVLICEFYQESNAFNPVLSGHDLYRCADPVWQEDRQPQYIGDEGLAIQGMIDALKEQWITPVFGPGCSAPSGGPVEHTLVEGFMSTLMRCIQAEAPLDGVLVSMHGATVSDRSNDVCGDILAQLRSLVGETVPICASFDMHANITAKITDNLNCLTGYQTYPHLDMYETGFRAAKLLICLQDKPLYTACVRLPMIAPANGYTTQKGSFGQLTKELAALPAADWSVFMAQPWLDVEEICAAVIIISPDKAQANACVERMGQKLWAMRQELQGEPLSDMACVVRTAMENKSGKPIILADSADSPNAGATGDCATVLEHMLPFRDSLRCAVSVNDAPAVEQAFRLGVGAKADFKLGAKMAPNLSKPVLVKDAVVRSLHSGTFLMEGPAERGSRQELGRCAVLDAGQIQILVTTSATRNGDLQFYRAFGIEPTLCQLVSVKACTSFRAGYAPIAEHIINTSTPGASASDLRQLPFRKLPKPLYPFQEP